jgi:serine beta-lactamase-like protein LACTB, mitochondrial
MLRRSDRGEEAEFMSGTSLQKRALRAKLCGLTLAISAVLAGAALAQAQTATTDVHAEARANADKQAKEWLTRGIAGLSLTVAIDGKIVYSEGFGYADLEERVPAWTTTKFRIGSISKPLTAVGLMELVEAGKVNLDAPVQKYVPSFPDKGAPITVRMVAGHLAGIRHYNGDEFLIQKHYDNVLDGLKIFENDPLVSAPGTGFHYSSYGFNLLSAVIESASGEKFLDYMQRHVFDAIGLAHTTPDQNVKIVEERSRFYEKEKDGTLENAPYVDNSYKWAGGGFLSTSEDLVRFGSAMLRPGVLNEAALKEMFTPQRTKSGKPIEYGIGWFVGKSKSGEATYAHSGGSVGGTSQLIIYPETHVVVALVTNMSNGEWKREEVEEVAEKFAPGPN